MVVGILSPFILSGCSQVRLRDPFVYLVQLGKSTYQSGGLAYQPPISYCCKCFKSLLIGFKTHWLSLLNSW